MNGIHGLEVQQIRPGESMPGLHKSGSILSFVPFVIFCSGFLSPENIQRPTSNEDLRA
jgi:hypothetical protein